MKLSQVKQTIKNIKSKDDIIVNSSKNKYTNTVLKSIEVLCRAKICGSPFFFKTNIDNLNLYKEEFHTSLDELINYMFGNFITGNLDQESIDLFLINYRKNTIIEFTYLDERVLKRLLIDDLVPLAIIKELTSFYGIFYDIKLLKSWSIFEKTYSKFLLSNYKSL